MERKQKKFFKRKGIKNTNIPTSGVDICNVNIISEAEKIIDDYVSRMGYGKKKKKYVSAKTVLAIITGISAFVIAALVMKTVMP